MFAQARVHYGNKTRPIGLNHDYQMTFLNTGMFHWGKNNFITIEHIYNESTNLIV